MVREGHHPLEVIRQAKKIGIRSVAVAVSCGKDSTAVLDVCSRHFDRVHGFFMYFVKGISFQEQYLAYLERKYSVEIMRVPHWALANLYRQNIFRHPTAQSSAVKSIKVRHIESWVRAKLGVSWVATGEKYCDSIERNTQLVQSRGIDASRHRIWPIAWWKHSDVDSYLAGRQIMLPPDYRLQLSDRDRSVGAMISPDEIVKIREHFPDDYRKIVRSFPLVESQIIRYQMLKEKHG